MGVAYPYLLLRRPSLITSLRLLRYFNNKHGIVIGGHLRWHFKYLLKTAKEIINVDSCPSNLPKSTDIDYITDSSTLFFAKDETLDFVCSSHVLEHLANPLKAINEWKRVLKQGGIIYAGVPDKRHTFDRKRPRTSLSHLIDDLNNNVDQTDKTHLPEYLDNWEKKDSCENAEEQVKESVMENPESLIHHHAWVVDDIKEILQYMGLNIIYGPVLHHGTIHIIGQKYNST